VWVAVVDVVNVIVIVVVVVVVKYVVVVVKYVVTNNSNFVALTNQVSKLICKSCGLDNAPSRFWVR